MSDIIPVSFSSLNTYSVCPYQYYLKYIARLKAYDADYTGTEVYIHLKSEEQVSASAYLGFTIQKGLSDILGINNRGIKYGNFQVLRDNDDSSAAVLLELGFLSQTDEAIYLTKEKSQSAVALVILQSIIKFLGYE